jgi:hypothetical protein
VITSVLCLVIGAQLIGDTIGKVTAQQRIKINIYSERLVGARSPGWLPGGRREPPVHPSRVTRATGGQMTIRPAGHQPGE